MLHLKLIFFPVLILFNILGYSIVFKKIFKLEDQNLFNNLIYGSLLIATLSYGINFFSPLTLIITNIFFAIFTILGFFYIFNIKNVKEYSLIFLILSIVSLMTYYSKSYNDYELYHLPYMELIRKFKIIFGISNLDFRFGHSSVLQNISAFQYNNLMGYDSYIFFSPILTVSSIIFLLRYMYKTKDIKIFLISLIIIIFYAIHASRYSSLGNDYPTHALASILIVLFLDTINSYKENNSIFIIFCLCTLIILSKFSLVFFSFIPLYLLIFKRNVFFLEFSIYKVLFLLFLTSLFFIKNIVNTSCLVYPIPYLCFNTTWSLDKYEHGSPEIVSVISSRTIKNYVQSSHGYNFQKKKDDFTKSFLSEEKNITIHNSLSEYEKENFIDLYYVKDFLKFKNWIFPYLNGNDFLKLIKNVLLLNFILFFVIILFLEKKIRFFKQNLLNKFNLFLKKNIFFVFFITFNFIIWFLYYPQLRYGFSYCIIFFLIPLLIYFEGVKFELIEIKLIKISKILILISLIYFLYFNFIKISENYSSFNENILNYNYSEIIQINSARNFKEKLISNAFIIREPLNGPCANTEQFCTIMLSEFERSERSIYINKWRYLTIK